MIIEIINRHTIKAFISKKEIKNSYKTDKKTVAKEMLKLVFREIDENTFPRKNGRISVNIITKKLGMELTVINSKKISITDYLPLIFRFNSVSDLQNGARLVIFPRILLIYKSDLLLYDGMYYLLIYPMIFPDNKFFYSICEYSDYIGRGHATESCLKEHGKILCVGDAIEQLSL